MRIRRTLIAPALLTIGTIGSVVAGPVLAITTAAAPAANGVAASSITPDIFGYHA